MTVKLLVPNRPDLNKACQGKELVKYPVSSSSGRQLSRSQPSDGPFWDPLACGICRPIQNGIEERNQSIDFVANRSSGPSFYLMVIRIGQVRLYVF